MDQVYRLLEARCLVDKLNAEIQFQLPTMGPERTDYYPAFNLDYDSFGGVGICFGSDTLWHEEYDACLVDSNDKPIPMETLVRERVTELLFLRKQLSFEK